MSSRKSEAAKGPQRRRRPYVTGREEIDRAVSELVSLVPTDEPRQSDLLRQIVTTAAKMVLEEGALGDLKLVNSALKELRWSFRVFSKHRRTRKVSVFGSARTQPGEPAYEQARDFGQRMAELGWGVITGAGGGIMAAAHGGAGREASFGVNIELPFEQQANPTVRGGQQLVNFKYFFTRKLVFLKETDAIVLFPGGYGTHDEGFETLTLIQTGKADPLPVVFLEPPGSRYWAEWNDYVERHLKQPGLISDNDTALYRITADAGEAVDELLRFYRVYHSQRYVGERLVIRIQSELSPVRLAELNREFAPLLVTGRIEQGPALPEEAAQEDIGHLPRLVLHYNRADAAGLRQLIDAVNDTEAGELRDVAHVGPDPHEERSDRGGMPEPDEPEEIGEDPDPE